MNNTHFDWKYAPPQWKSLRAVRALFCLLIITACLAGVVSAAGFSGGDGSPGTPYLISNEDDLRQLATDVNGGTNYASNYFELTQNIALNGEWTPIGNSNPNYFRGTFDGAGYTVNGFSITQVNSVAGEHHYGLFGYLGGTVKNLNVAGSITLTGEQSTSNIGGLAGYLDYGTIQNCTSDVSISASSSAVIYVGGLVGNAYGQISESSATGDVTTTTTYAGVPDKTEEVFTSSTGGLVGYIKGGKIENCYASGTVRAENNADTPLGNSPVLSAGGIVGYNSVALTNCFSTSQVNADFGNGRAYAGGITGWQLGATSNCFTTGSVTANTTSKFSYSGGIAGMSFTSITACYATGKVTANPTEGNSHAGGIVGFSSDTTSNCYALNSDISGKNMNGTAGYGATLTSNYVLNGLFTPSDGTSVASSKVWNQVFGLFTDANGWKINEGNNNFKLPVLKNLPAPANADASHLSVPCITFNANGGTGTMQPLFVEGNSVTLNANKFKKEGYSFTGWNTEASGSGTTYANMTTIQDVNADITLFAQWKINEYTLRFEDYDCSSTCYYEKKFEYGADISGVSIADPEKDGYTFTEWYLSYKRPTTMPAWDVTIYAKWEVTKYTVSFEENDGSEVADLTDVEYNSGISKPTNPEKHGYTFAGWYKDPALTTPWVFYDENKDVVTTDTTLYAKWTGWIHTVELYNYYENAVQSRADVKILTYGEDTKLKANPFSQLQGKYFGGWATTEGGAVVYKDEADVSSLFTADNLETKLYAVWLDTPITYRKVTFMIDSTNEYQTKQIQDGKALGLSDKPTDPTREGYAFAGWYKESTLDTALSFDNDYVVDADTKIYAKWNPIFYYVQFNNNTGTGTMVNQKFQYGVAEALSANTFTAPSGKEFAGWNTKADGSGDSYAAGYDKSDITVKNEDTVILYAQWKDIGGGNDGSDSGSDSDSDYDDYEPSTPSTPSTPSKPSTPTTPDVPDTPDTPKVTDETKEISVSEENTVTLPTGDKVVVVALENTEAVQRVAVPEAVAQANPGASVKVTEGETAPALPERVAADNVPIVVGVSVVDKEGNPVKITESGYFILDADVPAGKKLVVGHYKNDIWVDCLVEDLGNGQHKVHYNGLSPFAAVIIEEHEESPFTTEEKPTEEPAETPAPILGMVLGGLAAAVVLRRK